MDQQGGVARKCEKVWAEHGFVRSASGVIRAIRSRPARRALSRGASIAKAISQGRFPTAQYRQILQLCGTKPPFRNFSPKARLLLGECDANCIQPELPE